MHYLQFTLLCLLLFHEIFSAPLQDTSNYQNMISKECIPCLIKEKNNQPIETKRISGLKTYKKDVFMSRGWGAGGMPFSVLYMNPSHSSKAPATEIARKPSSAAATPKPQHITVPQVRNSMRQKGIHRISHSVIPQLFVSYGWGPHGKK